MVQRIFPTFDKRPNVELVYICTIILFLKLIELEHTFDRACLFFFFLNFRRNIFEILPPPSFLHVAVLPR